MLRATNISFSRGGRMILSGVNLELTPGELTVLIGPNGAGKSTLIDILCGEETPDTGSVELDGEDLHQMRVLHRARKRAVMTQSAAVSFAFTVEEVIQMGRECWVRTPAQEDDDAAVAHALAVTELAPLAEAPVTEISGGERQRTAFARVLAQRTPLIFLDEPVAAMDIKHQEETLAAVRELCAGGAAALVVLHDLSTAAFYADKLLLLAEGQLKACGTPAQVCTPELLSDAYGTALQVHCDAVGKVYSILPARRGLATLGID